MCATRVVHVNDNVPGAVYIGRAMPGQGLAGSLFANPFRIGPDGDREDVIAMYRAEMRFLCRASEDHLDALRDLVGKPLACWCRHDGEARTDATACHGDVLVEIMRELELETPATSDRELVRLATIHHLSDYASPAMHAKGQGTVGTASLGISSLPIRLAR